MTSQKWILFIVSALTFVAILLLLNTIIAGVFYLFTLLFESKDAPIVFKWVFCVLSILDIPISIPALYNSVKKQGGNDSGT